MLSSIKTYRPVFTRYHGAHATGANTMLTLRSNSMTDWHLNP